MSCSGEFMFPVKHHALSTSCCQLPSFISKFKRCFQLHEVGKNMFKPSNLTSIFNTRLENISSTSTFYLIISIILKLRNYNYSYHQTFSNYKLISNNSFSISFFGYMLNNILYKVINCSTLYESKEGEYILVQHQKVFYGIFSV